MKAIVVRNPWAWCITQAAHDPTAKTVENRTWTTTHRGDLAIIEGRVVDWEALDHPLVRAAAGRFQVPGVAPWEGTRGAVVCVTDLHHICLASRSGNGLCTCPRWAVSGEVHWRLANVRVLREPVLVRGRQGLFDLPPDVTAAVRGQLAVTS